MNLALNMNQAAPSISTAELEIEIREIRKSYGETPILKGLNLEIPKGQAVALIGSNGSGKSTLLRCTTRLIEPDSGEVILHGQNITKLTGARLREARSKIGFVFQHHNLVPRLSVLSNVLHGALGRKPSARLWFQSLATNLDREEAMYCLERVGLAQFAARRVTQLSGGQSQRVAIARALMQRPTIIMADEPVASLDPQAGEEVMNLFFQLSRSENLTLLFCTHHLEHAVDYADRVVGLSKGTIQLDQESSSISVAELRGIYD
ncbi:MAG: phosphonate ABC transporter ATP-binding protein [Deltaproteobacteria bacterium]|nr:phosphonate ABC transporter ATP-binding protein [Deltaproteobacteria bacterium]